MQHALPPRAPLCSPLLIAGSLCVACSSRRVGHPCLHVIGNDTNFNGKIRKVMLTICQFVGVSSNIGMSKRKFLVSPSSIEKVAKGVGFDSDRIAFPQEVRYSKFEVDHDYITRPEQDASHQLRLRRRGLNGQFTYSYTLRYPDLHGQRVELKRLIKRREYFDLLLQRDPATQTITKKRYSFLMDNQYFELDQFISPHKGLYLLEFYASREADVSKMLPKWLRYEGEVTNNKDYSMYNLALKKPPRHASPTTTGAGHQARHARSASVTRTQSEIAGEGTGEAAHALEKPERQSSSGLLAQHGLDHACASAPTSPQITPAISANAIASLDRIL